MPAAFRESAFVQSFRKNAKGILLMTASAFIIAFAQFIWKLAGSDNLPMIAVGIALYGLSSVLMIIAFRYGSLSVLHPIMAVNYAVGVFLGVVFLHEVISSLHLAGIGIIMLGVILIGGGDA